MRLVLAALCALLLAAPAAAHIPGLGRYTPIAEAAFPDSCGPTVVQLHEVQPPTAAWFQPWDCTIAFPARGLHDWDPLMICSVLVHEMGHAAGFGHSADPMDVMFYEYRRPYWRCRKLLRPRSARR